MKEAIPTIVYIIVCDNDGDKYVCQSGYYGEHVVFHEIEDAVVQRNMLEYDYPHNKYYIKDIIL